MDRDEVYVLTIWKRIKLRFSRQE